MKFKIRKYKNHRNGDRHILSYNNIDYIELYMLHNIEDHIIEISKNEIYT